MFQPLQTEIDNRFANVAAYFAATKTFQGSVGATAKGYMFVEIYAIYEYTVRTAVQTAISSLNSRKHRLCDLTPTLLALYLDPELRSLRDAGNKKVWEARRTLFAKAFAKDAALIAADTKLPDDGSHFRYSHLLTIMAVFNIRRRPVRNLQHVPRINEVVDHRNQIAHGSDTAENIGRRYTRAEVLTVLRQMRSVCNCIVALFDGYCSTPQLQLKR
jgi:hypothetical protein